MTLLYVFPHPDDESFGPAPAIARQVREGHAVHLLTLTRGGATRQRHALAISVEEMGETRLREMKRVAETLGLASLRVLDLPDGGLDALDPRIIETVVQARIEEVWPDVLVTYTAYGNSGHADHLVTHAVVKRVYSQRRAEGTASPRRLALFSLVEDAIQRPPDHLRGVAREKVGAVVTYAREDLEKARAALACYATYAEVVAEHDPLKQVEAGVAFVLFGESVPRPPLGSLGEAIAVGPPPSA